LAAATTPESHYVSLLHCALPGDGGTMIVIFAE
jgi:hypothetical protein